jgi:hypothetical protein
MLKYHVTYRLKDCAVSSETSFPFPLVDLILVVLTVLKLRVSREELDELGCSIGVSISVFVARDFCWDAFILALERVGLLSTGLITEESWSGNKRVVALLVLLVC